MQSLEGQFDCCTEQLFEVGLKLEQKEKVLFHCGFFHFGVERIRLLIIACCWFSKSKKTFFWFQKAYSSAEGDVGGLSRRALLIEEEVERSEERLAKAVTELAGQSQRADAAIKKRQQLENLNRCNIVDLHTVK